MEDSQVASYEEEEKAAASDLKRLHSRQQNLRPRMAHQHLPAPSPASAAWHTDLKHVGWKLDVVHLGCVSKIGQSGTLRVADAAAERYLRGSGLRRENGHRTLTLASGLDVWTEYWRRICDAEKGPANASFLYGTYL